MDKIAFPAPKLLYFDDSREICDLPYLFMSYIEGDNYLENKEKLSPDEIKHIEYEIGCLSSKICSIESGVFFLTKPTDKKI